MFGFKRFGVGRRGLVVAPGSRSRLPVHRFRLFSFLHHLRIARPLDATLFRLVVSFRREIAATLGLRFVLFDFEWMLANGRVGANAGHLPRNFYTRRVGLDDEAIVFDLIADNGLRESADNGELIAEVAVDGLEPIWQGDCRLAAFIRGDVAAVDVENFRGFDGGVIEVLISGSSG